MTIILSRTEKNSRMEKLECRKVRDSKMHRCICTEIIRNMYFRVVMGSSLFISNHTHTRMRVRVGTGAAS